MLGIGRENRIQQFSRTTFQELIDFLIINSKAIVTFPLVPISEAGSRSHIRIKNIRLHSEGVVGRLEYECHVQGVSGQKSWQSQAWLHPVSWRGIKMSFRDFALYF